MPRFWALRLAGLLFAAACFGLPASSRATDITTCGDTVGAGDTGVLQADLDCSGSGTFAVRLLRKATLDLNGHSLTGGPTAHTVLAVAASDGAGHGNVTIVGPGVIAGTAPDLSPFFSGNACLFLNDGRARITSASGVVDIHGCETGIVGGDSGETGRVTMDHVELHDNVTDGSGLARAVASDVNVYDHFKGVGLAAKRIRLMNVSVHDNNIGMGGQIITGSNVTANNNRGPDPNRAGGNGIFTGRSLNLTNLTATGNTNPGVFGVRVRLVDSQVTNNGLRPPHVNVDIESDNRPVLINSTCLHSERSPVGGNWGVCADD